MNAQAVYNILLLSSLLRVLLPSACAKVELHMQGQGTVWLGHGPIAEVIGYSQLLRLGQFKVLCFTGKFPSLSNFSQLLVLLPIK